MRGFLADANVSHCGCLALTNFAVEVGLLRSWCRYVQRGVCVWSITVYVMHARHGQASNRELIIQSEGHAKVVAAMARHAENPQVK